jgi:hypothetical protein
MNTKFDYYYNNVPGKGLCRNNLIYTSLISDNKQIFCQWYHNDTDYHRGQNQVVDPTLMDEKFEREVKFLKLMSKYYPQHVPVYSVDYEWKKIYLEIDGPDMWERAGCAGNDYSSVLPDWKEQMLEIIQAHKDLGIYKYSMHPSSYFVVDGKLKSINYFFTYDDNDNPITPASVMSHISEDRKKDLFPKMEEMGIRVNNTYPFRDLQILAFDSFKTNFSNNVMEEAKKIYV